jgi:S-adenosyl-L-methionine hydrolase (adenosine-forming)
LASWRLIFMPAPLIALTTDYGSGSTYVAQLKGVLLSALPDARLLDVTHDVAPQSIREAELVMRSVAFALPLGTTHVVVVDPGVGTSRRGIAVRAGGMTFVGPDNGVLGVPLARPDALAVVLDRPHLFREPVSRTFHGRDIFAPVAAELAAGLPLDEVGTPITDALGSTLPAPSIEKSRVRGMTLGVDRFGNLMTNVPAARVAGWRVELAGRVVPRVETYAEAEPSRLVALAGSDGWLEIAVRDGSAAALLEGRGVGLEVVCSG